MGNIKARDENGKFKVVASSEATGIGVRDPKLIDAGKDFTSVEDVLLNQQEDIDKLKGNVSWLAKNGGGGNGGGGGGGGSATTEATVKILVNGNENGVKTSFDEKGLTVSFTDVSINATKNWTVNISINGINIATRNDISFTNRNFTLPYDSVVKYPDGTPSLINHAGNLVINANYEDDDKSIYGYAGWTGEILEAVVNLSVANVAINLDDDGNVTEDAFIVVNYSAGITGEYTIRVVATQGNLTFTKEYPVNLLTTGNNNFAIDVKELITNILPGEYQIVTTIVNKADNNISKEVRSTINFISSNLTISSNILSTDQNNPIEVPISSSINLNWICYGQGVTVFKYDYVVNGVDIVKEKNGTIGRQVNDYIPLINLPTVVIGHTVGITIKAYAGDMITEKVVYFKFIEATGNFIEHHASIKAATLFDFKSYDYTTNTSEFTLSNPDYAQGGYAVGISTVFKTVNGSNLNGIKSQTTVPPYLRFCNGAYGKIEKFTVGNAERTLKQIVQNNNYQFSFQCCFKADYHPDDNRTILSIADIDINDNTINSIEINVHNILVNGISVIDLIDNEFNDVAVTVTKDDSPYINNAGELTTTSKWICKIYTEGTLSAVKIFENSSSVVGSPTIYIAGRDNLTGDFEGVRLTDVNIYSIAFYTAILNDEDILVNYINNKVLHTYNADNNFDFDIITAEARKSFCEIDNTNHLTSYIYSRNSDRYDINFIIKNEKLDQDKLNAYAKVLGLPVMFIDVSTMANWTFNNFVLQQSVENKTLDDAVGQKIQYYDPNGQNTTICDINNVTVGLQGTSTLGDAVKNINITLPYNKEDTTVFVPKSTWLPESTYTLKADVVDSSHSNNAAIGKFINEVINDEFPYSPDALANVEQSNYVKNQQPTATLKHTVEGFPVLLIMKFRTEKPGDVSITPLGIYNFNLGRNAYRNLGFRKINSIKKDGVNINVTSFPYFAEHTVVDEEDSNANWIEVKDTYSVPDLQRIKDNTLPTQFNTSTGDFWQTAPNILNLMYEVRYGNRPNPSEYSNFTSFVNFITQLPIEAPIKVTDRNGTKNISMISGEYDKYDYVNGAYVKTNNKLQMMSDYNSISDYNFNVDSFYRYFVIANIFGLVDNFGKNSTYRSWNNGDYFIGFYDMDTALGGDNQGELTINPDCWNKCFKNRKLEGELYGWFEESYNNASGNIDAGIDGDPEIIGGGGISAKANKIWLSIDTNTARLKFDKVEEDVDGSPVQVTSQYAFQYKMLTEALNKKALAAGYTNFVEYFIQEFYNKQCGDCGPLLFNLDYRLKYLVQFTDNSYGATNLKFASKLHGRKQSYTKYWLNNRITFLDSWFAFKQIQSYIRPNDYGSSINLKVYNTPKTIPVRFNTPLLFNFKIGNASTSWYYAPKNTDVFVDAGSNSSGSVLDGSVNNSPQLLQIGNDEYKLASINVNLIGANVNNDKLNTLGLPCFISLGLANNSSFSPTFNLDAFKDDNVAKYSELREIDFSNTKCIDNTSKFNLNLYNFELGTSETKFGKLRSIKINGSSCINQIFIPAIPLRELNITNSSITELNLDNQNYLDYVDITGCDSIRTVNINECAKYDRFEINNVRTLQRVYITNNPLIRYVKITNCNSCEELIIQNCPNLTSIEIIPNSGKDHDPYKLNTVTLIDLPKLTFIKIQDWTGLNNFTITNCNEANITTFNTYSLGFNHINGGSKLTSISYDGGTDPIVDLSDFKKATFDFRNCNKIVHLQLPNETTPINYTLSFKQCTLLKRIYGHFKITNPTADTGCFRSLTNFSFQGRGNNGKGLGTWKGKSYINDNMVGTPWEIIKNITDFGNKNIDFEQFDKIKIEDFYQSGKLVTNLRFNGNTDYNSMLRGTPYTMFDIYYVLAVIALTGGQTNKTLSYCFSSATTTLGYTPFDSTHPINRCMFVNNKWNLNDMRIPNAAFNAPTPNNELIANEDGTKELVITIDNGLFSPRTEANTNYIEFNNTFYVTKATFRRKNGTYKYKTFNEFYATTTSSFKVEGFDYDDCTDMFKDLPDLENIIRSFKGTSFKWDTLVLPDTIKQVYKSFYSAGRGVFDLNKVLPGSDVTHLVNCFKGSPTSDGSTNFYIKEGMFRQYPNLVAIGENRITDHDIALSDFPFKDFTKDIEGNVFPYNIFNNNPKLESAIGVFYNIKGNKTYVNELAFPGALFDNTPNIKYVDYLFYKFRLPYKLTPNSFANCPNLYHINNIFAQEVTQTYRGGPTGEIPYRLFYHGETPISKTLTTITEAQYNALKAKCEEKVTVPAVGDTPASERDHTAAEINTIITDYINANAVKKTWNYSNPIKTIIEAQGIFEGCVNLESYINNNNQDPFIPNNNKEGEIGQYYLNRNVTAGKYTLDALIPVSQDQAYDRIMLGEIGDFDNDPKKADANTTKDKYTIDRALNNNSIEGKDKFLNYAMPRDLFRYCTTNCRIDRAFRYQGIGLVSGVWNTANGNETSIKERVKVGIKGTIPKDLLEPLSDITSVRELFYGACAINSFIKNSQVYVLDPEFFSYAPKITNLYRMFTYAIFDNNINLNIFIPLTGRLNIICIFAACYYGESNGNKTAISGIFINNNINNITGAFSTNPLNINEETWNVSSIPENSGVSNSANFLNNFAAGKVPSNITYVYYGNGTNNAQDDAAIPKTGYNY